MNEIWAKQEEKERGLETHLGARKKPKRSIFDDTIMSMANGDVDALRNALETRGLSPNECCEHGYTLLMYALMPSDDECELHPGVVLQMVQLLLENGASTLPVSKQGFTATHWANQLLSAYEQDDYEGKYGVSIAPIFECIELLESKRHEEQNRE